MSNGQTIIDEAPVKNTMIIRVKSCLERGLLVNRLKPNALRFMPSLIIGNEEVDQAIDILDRALGSVVGA